MNLIELSNKPFEPITFSKIKTADFIPGIKKVITECLQEFRELEKKPMPESFSDLFDVLEGCKDRVDTIASTFFNLHSAESDDDLRKAAKDFSPLLSDYSNDLLFNQDLFKRVKYLYDKKKELNLSAEEERYLDLEYKSFVRNGALLGEKEKERLRQLDRELGNLSLVFSDNVLSDTNEFLMLLSEDDLEGLPERYLSSAKSLAKEKDHPDKWAVTLDYPSLGPFLEYSARSDLREKVYRAFSSRGCHDNKNNNFEHILSIVKLRNERAKLLGFKNHAHFILEERMASSPDKVYDFLENLRSKAFPKAQKELEKLKSFKQKLTNDNSLNRWDFSYYSRLYKQETFGFDAEELRPYFPLEKVTEGVFLVATKLYGIEFEEEKNVDVYHPDVRCYKVMDQGRFMGYFYTDFFPRAGKRGGAWMTDYRGQRVIKDKDRRPHVSIVCNFTKPTESSPSLLSFGEVTTLFHEFGHALHGLLSECHFLALSGPNVYWDFVELPSQLMENWCYEKECLDLFAQHFETGELIPNELIEKLNQSQKFLQGFQTLRQVRFSLVDMAWHDRESFDGVTVQAIEKELDEKTDVFPGEGIGNFSPAFSHIFAGGYSAGYYSYKWAEVLDADSFEAFKDEGLFNQETASRFRQEVLAKGGSDDPMELYKRFRGRGPDPQALLRRSGLA